MTSRFLPLKTVCPSKLAVIKWRRVQTWYHQRTTAAVTQSNMFSDELRFLYRLWHTFPAPARPRALVCVFLGILENSLRAGFCTLAAGLVACPTRNAPLMKSERFLCHATGLWVRGSARLEKIDRNQPSDVHNTMVANSSRPPALWCLVVCPSACRPAKV